jgi:hypothetical protein
MKLKKYKESVKHKDGSLTGSTRLTNSQMNQNKEEEDTNP